MGKMLGGEEKEEDPDAAKKEEERQEALRQQEEERKAKYAKMEAERETMRQGIRDKVRWREEGRWRLEDGGWRGGYSSSSPQNGLQKPQKKRGKICRNSGTCSERRLLKPAFYFCLLLFLSEISGALGRRRRRADRRRSSERLFECPSRGGWVRQGTMADI